MNKSQFIFKPLPELKFDKKRNHVKLCPCGKSNIDGKFVPYVGYENKGYCHSCGETFLPELPKVEQWSLPKQIAYKPRPVTPQSKPVSYIPIEVFKNSLNDYENNHFVKYLIGLFGNELTNNLIKKYFIGTSTHWNGATVFWQIDSQGKVRTGKIMLYNPITGKRVKEPFNHITWVHTVNNQTEFVLKQCLFGNHLLSLSENNYKTIAIVESEKTAIIASAYYTDFVWLAFGGIGFNVDKCNVLKGRKVILFPDINGFDKWSNKAKELSHITSFQISDLLERKATEPEREKGLDLADYLVRFDIQNFQKIPETTVSLSSIEKYWLGYEHLLMDFCNKPDIRHYNEFQRIYNANSSYSQFIEKSKNLLRFFTLLNMFSKNESILTFIEKFDLAVN